MGYAYFTFQGRNHFFQGGGVKFLLKSGLYSGGGRYAKSSGEISRLCEKFPGVLDY